MECLIGFPVILKSLTLNDLEIAIFMVECFRRRFDLIFGKAVLILKLVFRGAGSEDFVILAYVILIESQSVTDGRTDRQTPLPLRQGICIASYVNAL